MEPISQNKDNYFSTWENSNSYSCLKNFLKKFYIPLKNYLNIPFKNNYSQLNNSFPISSKDGVLILPIPCKPFL